ncbi:hypothetical protein CDD82_5011 [Ophiocordyceps australis]|uniref:Probable methionine--tRNA ligase, mitochondrial n=1 Tax=Ophiocordyceps australis TaxID=1399860 RepID=A0A2C5Y8A6_9HYPO|nr:hypothetical protein CDD82_5011 [Ophiocordyceps australis]
MRPSILRGSHVARQPLLATARSQWSNYSLKRLCRWNSSDNSSNNLDTASNNSSTSVSANPEKPFYITTPIFYVNGEPHIGHLFTLVLGDVMKRWQQLKGRQAFLSAGTDEHGIKVQREAEKRGISPSELCTENSELFRQLSIDANISHNVFIRTTDSNHQETVQHVFNKLRNSLPERLGLYKSSHQGWYCVTDECFYSEDVVRAGIDPQNGQPCQVNIETGNPVEWLTEDTWLFPLSQYKTRLLRWYDENPDWIMPRNRMAEVRQWVSSKLEDLSVTRPRARLSWGITDPGDDKQTIYVWIDALINYLTVTGYGSKWHTAKDDMGVWPADLQIIGKDILRFHAIYWPALLMALDLPLPKKLLCHGHWTLNDRKMSKSTGNVVDPFFAMCRWQVDPHRYCLARTANYDSDMNYGNQKIGLFYVKELQANLGNLLYRVTRPKANVRWSLREALESFRRGAFDKFIHHREPPRMFDRYVLLSNAFLKVDELFAGHMDMGNTQAALQSVQELLKQTNAFFSECAPWQLVKTDRQKSKVLLDWIIFNAGEALRVSSILLQPFMPEKATELLDELHVAKERRTLSWACKYKDDEYGADSLAQPSISALVKTEAMRNSKSETVETATCEGELDKQGQEHVQAAVDYGPRFRKWDTIFPPTLDTETTDKELRNALRDIIGGHINNKMYQMAELLRIEATMGEKNVSRLLKLDREIIDDRPLPAPETEKRVRPNRPNAKARKRILDKKIMAGDPTENPPKGKTISIKPWRKPELED